MDQLNVVNTGNIITYLDVDNEKYVVYTDQYPEEDSEVYFAKIELINNIYTLLPVISFVLKEKLKEIFFNYKKMMESKDEFELEEDYE